MGHARESITYRVRVSCTPTVYESRVRISCSFSYIDYFCVSDTQSGLWCDGSRTPFQTGEQAPGRGQTNVRVRASHKVQMVRSCGLTMDSNRFIPRRDLPNGISPPAYRAGGNVHRGIHARKRGRLMRDVRALVEKPALTVAEVALLTGFSSRTVIRIFEREAGVLIVARPTAMNKRRYRSIRIPRPVYERVIAKYRVR
jgi:hypothetical protein